jgi:hypothetical protein
MSSVIARLALTLGGTKTKALDLGNGVQTFAESLVLSFTDGTAANQVDKAWTDQRTLVGSATEDLDLAASLVDAFGDTVTFVKLKAVIILAAAGNTNNVNVTRPGSNGLVLFLAAGDGIAIKPGGCFVWACPGTGITVTAATGDLLTFTNSAGGTDVIYDVILLGTSA